MIDREYIIGGLENFLCNTKAKKSCEINGIMLSADNVESIVALLKAQKPVEPKKLIAKVKNGYRWRFYCGKCGGEIDRLDKYCRYCGQAVRWE